MRIARSGPFSELMRPNELVIAALSPLSYAMERLGLSLRVRPPKLPYSETRKGWHAAGDRAATEVPIVGEMG